MIRNILIILIFSSTIYSQGFFDFSIYYNYTNTSKFFLQPKSPNPVVRSSYNELNDIISLSSEIRILLIENLYAGVWVERIEKTFVNKNFNLGSISMDINDGYQIIPVEILFYYYLPFSTKKFKFFIGGGTGLYFGKSLRQFNNVYAKNDGLNIDFGIQISFLIDYVIADFIFLRTQMRFRDPDIELKSKYSDSSFTYNNKSYIVYPQTYTTKVNVDGISLCFGLGVLF